MEQLAIWATQDDMVKSFGVDQSVISKHITNIFTEGELDDLSNMQKMHITRSAKPITSYTLDVILSVGYRKDMVENTAAISHQEHFLIKLNTIYHSDCVNLMESMEENFVDLTVTSPPYDKLRNYNGYDFSIESIAKSLFRVTKNGGVVVWVVGDKIKNGNRSLTSFKQALFFQSVGFNVHDVMIYKKKNTPFIRTNAYTNCYEFMLVLSKGSPKTFNPLKVKTARSGNEMLPFNKGADGINKKVLKELKTEKTRTNIWEYATGLGGTTSDRIAFKHPAVYPEKLAEDHILSWTNLGDVVFDPMCGSGTTCKMALVNNRLYIGCDISKEYVELTEKRLGLVTQRIL